MEALGRPLLNYWHTLLQTAAYIDKTAGKSPKLSICDAHDWLMTSAHRKANVVVSHARAKESRRNRSLVCQFERRLRDCRLLNRN